MRKQLIFLLVVLALAITGCAAQSTPPATALPATIEASEAAPTAALTASPVAEQPTAAANPATTAEIGPAAPPGCTVVSQDTAAPEDSPFPEISEQDWVLGPADAYVSIIEYGDFQ